jgi:hypothetical protein
MALIIFGYFVWVEALTKWSAASGARRETWHLKKHIADRPLQRLLCGDLSNVTHSFS